MAAASEREEAAAAAAAVAAAAQREGEANGGESPNPDEQAEENGGPSMAEDPNAYILPPELADPPEEPCPPDIQVVPLHCNTSCKGMRLSLHISI